MKIELTKADQSRTISTICSKGFPLILAALLLASGSPAMASWLDSAVAEKSCPATPVNVPGDVLLDSAGLLKQITISGDTLQIEGTDNPDHIVISAAGASGLVRVQWNGEHLGRFGPISRIVVKGNGGDDVLIVKSDVHLPVVLDGGPGDDCIQSGSGGGQLLGGDGDDVLIAGTGRPALNGGSGSNRIVVPQPMGTLQYAPFADSGILNLLGSIYDLQPLSSGSSNSSNGTPSPIILGPADLADQRLLSLLQQAHTAGQAVVITNATQTDSENLRLMLGHPNAANAATGSTGAAAGATTPLTFFRTAQRPGTKAYDYSVGLFNDLSSPLDDRMIESLSQVFSAMAIVPQAPGDSPTNDLQNLANSYRSTNINTDDSGNSVRVTNMVWAVRSFQNQADYYYVQQEADYYQIKGCPDLCLPIVSTSTNTLLPSNFVTPAFYQPSPATTQCQTTTTSGTSWSIGGSTGWNQLQGLNAGLTGGVSVSNSETITCPATMIVNQSNPATGVTKWEYETQQYGGLQTYYNQWIWVVPFSFYSTGQTQIAFSSEADESVPDYWSGVATPLSSFVPLPFGDTFSLEKPEVSSVSPGCVNAGNTFTITGSALYPSLVTSVLIGGTPLSSTQYTPVSDTSLKVVAPNQSGEYLPVVVQTGEGVSNANVTIEISTINLCP
ncbi:MAG: IPT/TIG domain-containing protein [Bryobacteraceae bacterium]